MPKKGSVKKGSGLFDFLKNNQPATNTESNTQITPINQKDIDDIANNAKIIGTSGSSYLEINLKENQKIHASSGSMVYMMGNISMPEAKYDGFGKLFAGEDIFFQEYTGTKTGIGKSTIGIISLGMDFPNDIIRIPIPLNIELRISQGSFLACTENIKITYTTQFKGILGIGQDEGFILPVAKCISGTMGYIWLCSYGTFNLRKIAKDDAIILDNGIFLATNNENQYEVIKIGKSIIGSFLTGEGFGMKFNGPCEIYTQSKSMTGFMDIIQSNISTETYTTGTSGDLGLGDIGLEMTEGGKKTKSKTSKKIPEKEKKKRTYIKKNRT
jgi:uncharacterized protein (AIM24 family)